MNDELEIHCPLCKKLLKARHSVYWTGMQNIITKYRYECSNEEGTHSFSVFGKTNQDVLTTMVKTYKKELFKNAT